MNKLNPANVNRADLIVGIPSYNESDTISYVVEQAAEGLKKYLPDFRSVIINVDNNSPDDTKGAFMNAPNGVPKIYISTPPRVKGKGNNFYNLFQEMVHLNARAAVVVDADLSSITPEWIRELASPILNGYDYATPLYSRNEYDGTITNNICYPLLYGLLGKDIRQPIGGDFSFSLDLAKHYLNQEWLETTRQYGIDIFMTMHAILGGFECSQVGLGAKIHKPSAPKLGPMFIQVVETLFQTLLTNKSTWLDPISVAQYPHFGVKELDAPQGLSVDYKNMKATAMMEFNNHHRTLAAALDPIRYRELCMMFESGRIRINSDLWMRTVYDLLFAYDTTDLGTELIEAMKSLYFGRVVSFIKQSLDKDHAESERMIQRQARHFYRNRDLLIQRYTYKRAVA
ncbi:glycosyltransferase [bacterium]|nr:glycosyltransferase [bacterium]